MNLPLALSNTWLTRPSEAVLRRRIIQFVEAVVGLVWIGNYSVKEPSGMTTWGYGDMCQFYLGEMWYAISGPMHGNLGWREFKGWKL